MMRGKAVTIRDNLDVFSAQGTRWRRVASLPFQNRFGPPLESSCVVNWRQLVWRGQLVGIVVCSTVSLLLGLLFCLHVYFLSQKRLFNSSFLCLPGLMILDSWIPGISYECPCGVRAMLMRWLQGAKVSALRVLMRILWRSPNGASSLF